MRTANDSTFTFRTSKQDFKYITPFYLIASWFDNKQIVLNLSDPQNIDWGVEIDSQVTWSKNIDGDFNELYGLGRLIMKYNSDSLAIYAKPSDDSFLRKLNVWMSYGKRHSDTFTIKSKLCYPDYVLIHFAVTDTIGEWYQIELDSDKGTKYWVKDSNIFKFTNWPEYACEAFSVDWQNMPEVYRSPSLKSEKYNLIADAEIFKVYDFKGEWILIAAAYSAKNISNENSGWTRWRIGNKIVVWFFWTA